MRSRPIRLEVCFNEKEYENLCNLCEKTNLKKGRLIRLLLEGYVPPQAPPVDYKKLIREVRAVGNNINQILFYVNTNGILNVPDLNTELVKLREVEKFIREHYEAKRY